jgi:protein-S-isoprenylcysteine O-methyltransferase Ste14
MKKFVVFLLVSLFFASVQAQEKIAVTAADYSNNEVEMADLMRSEGKIYVLVGVIVLIFIGLLAYVIQTDRRVSKLEKVGQTK